MTPTESDHEARKSIAVENRQIAEEHEKEALYHAAMAVCLSTVGDSEQAQKERSRATVLRRTAQIKRDIAQKYDTHGEAASTALEEPLDSPGSRREERLRHGERLGPSVVSRAPGPAAPGDPHT